MDPERLEAQLKLHEGRNLWVYRDSLGNLTIGYGHCLTKKPISPEAANLILANDLHDAERELFLACPWVLKLDDVRHRVLLDMVFNLGIQGFLKFERMLTAVMDGRYEDAAAYMTQSLWATQVKSRAVRLAGMMRTGCDPPELLAPVEE